MDTQAQVSESVIICMEEIEEGKPKGIFLDEKKTANLPSSVTSNQLVRSYKNSFAFNYPIAWLMVRAEGLVSKLRTFLMVKCCCDFAPAGISSLVANG